MWQSSHECAERNGGRSPAYGSVLLLARGLRSCYLPSQPRERECEDVQETFLLHQLPRLADQLRVEVALTRGMKEMETSRSGGLYHVDVSVSVLGDPQVRTSDDSDLAGHLRTVRRQKALRHTYNNYGILL